MRFLFRRRHVLSGPLSVLRVLLCRFSPPLLIACFEHLLVASRVICPVF